jgi:hypothetical protein
MKFRNKGETMIMRRTLLASIVSIGLATSAYAGEYDYEQRIVLMYGQIWNGVAITAVAKFYSKTACEAAFDAYKKDSTTQIFAARPGLSKQFAPIFWHTCSPINPAMPS